MTEGVLVAGRRYRIRYRLPSQKADREFVGTCLGWSDYFRAYEFDLRPDSGTSQLPGDARVSLIEPVDKTVPHSPPTVVRGS